MAAVALPLELRAALDLEPASALLEYLAERFGIGDGHVTLELAFQDGSLRKGYRHHGPAGAQEIDELGRRDAPDVETP